MKKCLLLLLVALTGCSSQTTPARKTYLLPINEQAALSHVGTNPPLLIVRPVEMAKHLSGLGLVYQISDTEVVQAQHNLWAESISEQLTRNISNELRRKQSVYWPIETNPALSIANHPKLQIKFQQLNGHFSGVVKVSGEWLLLDGKGKLQASYPFQFQEPLQKDGYDAQVKALSECLSHLTSQIADKIATNATKTKVKLTSSRS